MVEEHPQCCRGKQRLAAACRHFAADMRGVAHIVFVGFDGGAAARLVSGTVGAPESTERLYIVVLRVLLDKGEITFYLIQVVLLV